MELEDDPLPPGTGLAIGSSLSQWAANLYLDGLDHFIKRELGIRAYLRYLDGTIWDYLTEVIKPILIT